MRSPPPVKAAVQLRHDQDPTELLRNLKRAPNLQDLMIHEIEVTLHALRVIE